MKNFNILRYKNRILNNWLLNVFGAGFLVSFLIFIPFIMQDKGFFLYYGDFNTQEIPFYMLAHKMIKTGHIFWNEFTDLGANFIGTYSFYMLGSPFFYLTLLFPNHAVPYLMGPLLMLKFAFATMFAALYLHQYQKNKTLCLLGALLYAFSGFSIYNIFFNHFHEAIVIFPLLLYSLDELLHKNRKFIFCLCTFLASVMNYYFFVGQAVFLVIYIIFKIYHFKKYPCKFNTLPSFAKDKTNNRSAIREIPSSIYFKILFEFFLGIFLSSFLLLPSIYAAAQNPRVADPPLGFEAFMHPFIERYFHIIVSFLFSPELPSRINFTPNSQANWSSISAYLPFFGVSGVIAYLKSNKKNWLKNLLIFLFIACLIPITNSIFQAFNCVFYTRWFYMLLLMMSLATVLSLKQNKRGFLKGTTITFFITLAVAVVIGFYPKRITLNDKEKIVFGLMNYKDRFFIYVAISLLSLFILIYFTNYCKNHHKKHKLFILCTSTIVIISSVFIIHMGKKESESTKNFIIPYCINGAKNITLPKNECYRVDFYEEMQNMGMYLNLPTIQAFNTIVPGSIMEFYSLIGHERLVSSNPGTSYFGIRSLASCKYLFDFKDKDAHFNTYLMPGWRYKESQNNFDIYENENFIPYGFSYTHYIPKKTYEKINQELRHLVLLKGIVLDESQEKKYGNNLIKIKNTNSIEFDLDSYFTDCKKRKESSCSKFEYTKTGFKATYDNISNKETLVFFSVPHEKGWKATVNNSFVPVEKVNYGFMAVNVPANCQSSIEFKYLAPGLISGGIISLVSLAIFILYVIISQETEKQNYSKLK